METFRRKAVDEMPGPESHGSPFSSGLGSWAGQHTCMVQL